MKNLKHHRVTAVLALLVMTMFVITAQASAAPKDRNHNGIPDSWEKKNDLSTKKDQGNRDADSDGVRNRCEFQGKTDPNNADSDGNGVADGDEDTDGDGATNRAESNLRSNCGRANSHLQIRRATVTSFADDTLVLTVRGGGTVTAPVSSTLKCALKDRSASTAAKGKKPAGCTSVDLVAGTKVHNARTKSKKYVAITLVK
jgi:hypothetical protein